MEGRPITRRRFVAGAGSFAAATILGPQAWVAAQTPAPTLRGRFAEGVLSGDPTPTGVTLLTRVTGASGRGTVELEVARERNFRRVVARRLVSTSGDLAHAVKAKVTGLSPYEQYFYRFSTRSGDSQVGRFRTALPADSRQPVRFAFFSCQEIAWGFFNAHERLAAEDVDFVVCLGDYQYGDGGAARDPNDVRRDTVGVADTLREYRAKYSLYRSDRSLQKMHAAHPMIVIWDDHEVQDNYAGGAGGNGGLAPAARYSLSRRRQAYRAFFERMPTYAQPSGRGSRLYRGFNFGRTVDLVALDQRQYRDDQPCNDAYIAEECAEYENERDFLGREQMQFVKRRLQVSRATWKVFANQVPVIETYFSDRQRLLFDTWQGYPDERRELLNEIQTRGHKGVVFATGDVHSFVAGDVRVRSRQDTSAVATEFIGGSITSKTFSEGAGGLLTPEDPNNPRLPEAVGNQLRQQNPWVRDFDFDHHGYAVARATRTSFECRLRRMATIKRRSTSMISDMRFTVTPGNPSLLT